MSEKSWVRSPSVSVHPRIFKMAYSNLSSQENFYAAFLKHRKGRYDANLDEQIQAEGKEILESHDPQQRKYRVNGHSIFWMVAAMCVFYYTDFYIALRVDPRIHRTWLLIGGCLIGLNILIGAYLIIWCSYIKKMEDWDEQNPILIPVATASFIVGFICCTYALWPLWSFLTPFINFTLFMGIIFLSTLLPI